MELLSVEHLKKYFPVTKRDGLRVRTEWYKAVDDITFHIGKGETFGLVGESGCGKTTVGKSILRLIEPTGGSVRLEGNEITGMNRNELRAQRKNMQMIFQDPYSSLDPQKRIVDTIGEPMKVHKLVSGKGELYDEVEKLLLMVGLNPQEARKYPHEFSGGQRQRIAIARALAVKPKLIVCDEPVSALDVSVQAQILNLMQDIQEQTGVSYLFIAHGMPVVQHISDRVGVMYLGKMVESTNAIDIFEDPKHPYTKGLMSAVAIPDPDIVHNSASLKGEIPNLTGDVKGCLFCGRCPECKKICQEQAPELKEIAPGHMVACHSSYYAMNNTIRIIGAILCVLSIVLSWIVSHSLLKNIHSMMKQIKLIGDGKANKKIEISSHDEIGELADSFNQLLSKLDSVNQRIIAEGLEKERIKYELLNLQLRSILTQIAPHLIGNLLGALSAYAVVGQTDKVESLSIHASNYIRSNAKCSEREYSTLGEEFQTIDNYIAMYQEIFDQPETYESHFEQEACRNMLVPSMLIHPLVENSLKYCGSDGARGMANIRISAKHTEKLLELCIEDTSAPFPEDVLAALEKMKRTGEDTEHKLGFGLAGTIRRLSLLYGNNYDFRIVQTDEFHKSILVTLPIAYASPST